VEVWALGVSTVGVVCAIAMPPRARGAAMIRAREIFFIAKLLE
jgi:hypothetical protein